MSSRSYEQPCSVARFLDQFGSRWTLLIIRDLLVGPRRFKELLVNMPSIGPNLLTERLHALCAQEIIEKVPTRDDSATEYVLTAKGFALEPVVLSMARWGFQFPNQGESTRGVRRPDLLVVALRAVFSQERARKITESYEFRVDDTTFFVAIVKGKLATGLGAAEQPAFVLTTDAATFDSVANGEIDAFDAKRRGTFDVAGDPRAFRRFIEIFGGAA